MRQQRVIILVLVLAMSIIGQPSFAMKGNRPWSKVDQLGTMIQSLTTLIAILKMSFTIDDVVPKYDPKNPETWVPHNGITYDPITGEPQLTWDDTEPALLNVEPLLLQLARDNAEQNHFAALPEELLPVILQKAGPKARTQCRAVSDRFKSAVDLLRMPIAKGGFGCSDTLGLIDTIHVGELLSDAPILHNEKLYIVSEWANICCVIDKNTNKIIAKINVGDLPQTPTVHGRKLFIVNYGDGTVSVINTDTDNVVATIEVGGKPVKLIVFGRMLYVADELNGAISVVDNSTNQVVTTINVAKGTQTPFLQGQTLYVVCGPEDDSNLGTLWAIDIDTNKVIAAHPLGILLPIEPVLKDQMLYFAREIGVESDKGVIVVFDTKTNQVEATVELGMYPRAWVAHAQTLYVACGTLGERERGAVFAIDTRTNQIVHAIEVGGLPGTPVIYGNMLYVVCIGCDGKECLAMWIINTNTNQVANIIDIDSHPQYPLIKGSMLYVPCHDGSIRAIDTRTNQLEGTVELDYFLDDLVVYGQKLYVVGASRISVIDIGGYLPGQC